MRIALWDYGLRPFFFAAGLAALVFVPWWAVSFAEGLPIPNAWPPSLWHSHEMLFGFIAAAVAGFLLTAVPSWTGARGFAGWPLMVLSAVWLLARCLISSSVLWPSSLVAGVDLLFFPVLASLLIPPLIRSRNRNTPLLAVLAAFWATDAAFYWGLRSGDAAFARHALFIGIDIVLLLVTVIGGRIVPAFTHSALQQRGYPSTLKTWPGTTSIAVASMLGVLVVDAVCFEQPLAGLVAAIAAVAQAVRLLQWQTRGPRAPIVWILHLGYLWLPIGLTLKAVALLSHAGFAEYYTHALTIGAATTMILGVMTRASLGHTGRALRVSPKTVLSYTLVTVATLVRVLGPSLPGVSYPAVILSAAALWTAAFALFLWVYAPILWRPRADGKPG